jgi:formiminoglutamase
MLAEIDELYVTVCLDTFPASIAPGVSAPSSLGISVEFVINMLHWIAQSQSAFHYNWQLTDIAEMNPNYDIDNRTAKLAARLIYEVVGSKFNNL